MYSPYARDLDSFTFSVHEVFNAYRSRRSRNELLQFREHKGIKGLGALSDHAFRERFGPEPWTIVNLAMREIGLMCEFDSPPADPETAYFPKLSGPDGSSFDIADLSSGEVVLLDHVLHLFAAAHLPEEAQLPELVLLDETDATLHPAMISKYLRIVDELFACKLGLTVVMVTHSPTTVALAPESTIYEMRRTGTPRICKVSRQEALQALTKALPTLIIKNEDRRTVFVESHHDADVYERVFELARRNGFLQDYSLRLLFVGSGPGGRGNDQAVKDMVRALLSNGNELVAGIVDSDGRNTSLPGIYVATERDAIENFVLDPAAVGALLLRENLVTRQDFGISGTGLLKGIGTDHYQILVQWVSTRLGWHDDAFVGTAYAGGFCLQVPSRWLTRMGIAWRRRSGRQFLSSSAITTQAPSR